MATGYSLIELVFVAGLVATLSAMAVPQTLAALDDSRTLGAARYMSARFQRARMEAVMRSVEIGIRFVAVDASYAYTTYADGNQNGVRSADIRSGVDVVIMPSEQLTDLFAHVDFGALPNLPPVDSGGTAPGSDPIRLGSANIASFNPNGTSTSGSVYIRGQRAQYVVRIYGDTGKTRIMRYDAVNKQWVPL
ncbi:MAG TPA: GspH/FimT family pseudopilin [Vicinamibacterales bacterium]|nr:GspH/FimT family pseudopilin [Vicinamibacterales bacterium]